MLTNISRIGFNAPSKWLSMGSRVKYYAPYSQLPMVTSVLSRGKQTTSRPPATPSPHHIDSQLSIYEGPFSQTARRLKLFSVSSLGATIALCPFIFLLDAGISNGMRGGLAVAAVATSGSSTALVQWCLGSYVRKITIANPSTTSADPNSNVISRSTPVSFETLSFWGGKRITTVKVCDLETSSAPFSTIRIRAGQRSVVRDGRGRVLSDGNQSRKRFYLHSELTEEEPLRTIMAEIQQSRPHISQTNGAAQVLSNSLDVDEGASGTPTVSGMSQRIDQLKRKASGESSKE
ncbi:hypothetical protein BGZ94_000746 [Podila epigama]|nr:hypothetical protein BGZ94_000746 [Podila epigama]